MHTTRRAVLVLVGQLSSQPLLTLPPEAKLIKVRIPPTVLTIEEFRFGFGFGFSLGSGFSSLGFSPFFPKNSLHNTLSNLMGS
jgi:hypothetical protein